VLTELTAIVLVDNDSKVEEKLEKVQIPLIESDDYQEENEQHFYYDLSGGNSMD